MHCYSNQPRGSDKRVHASTITAMGLAALRDIGAEDVEAIVRYWYTSGDEHLDFLGIDRSRLGTLDGTRQRLLRAIWIGDPKQKSLAFAITVNGDFAGYSVLQKHTDKEFIMN